MADAFRHVHRIRCFVVQYMILQSDCPPLPSFCFNQSALPLDCPFSMNLEIHVRFHCYCDFSTLFLEFSKIFFRFQSHRLSIQCIALHCPVKILLLPLQVTPVSKFCLCSLSGNQDPSLGMVMREKSVLRSFVSC